MRFKDELQFIQKFECKVALFFDLFQLSLPFEFLKCDPQTYEPIRTDSGNCIKVSKGEVSIFLIVIILHILRADIYKPYKL